MASKVVSNIQSEARIVNPKMMWSILAELRLLRKELLLLLPQDDLGDYVHRERIKKSHQKALKKYPPILT